MFKKCLSILLGILLMVVSFSVQPFTVLAQEVDIMEDGANVELTSVGGNYGVNLSHAGYQSPPNPYAYPQCTWYCWGRAYEKLGLSLPGWGHANTWDESADANPNFTVGTEARANSIMVENSTGVGHVMFVEKVENGYAYITEGNYLSSSYHEDRINLSRMVRDSWTTHQLSSVRYIYLSNPTPKGYVMSESEGAGRTIPDGDYWIGSKIAEDYFIDIPGNDFDTWNEKNVQTWKWDSGLPPIYDVFHMTYLNNGFYKITQLNTRMVIDVFGGNLERGSNVSMWEDTGSTAQQWSIEKTDGGYKIRSRGNNYYLDIYDGKYENGTNVLTWDNHEGDNQFFTFIPYTPNEKPVSDGKYKISSAVSSTCYLDVYGGFDDFKNLSNIEVYNSPDDTFQIEYLGNGYYRICELTSQLAVEVINDGEQSYLNNSRNVILYGKNNRKNQAWNIRKNNDGTFCFVNQLSGYYLDLEHANTDNGTNVSQYQYNGYNNQKWKLHRVIEENMITVGNIKSSIDTPEITVEVDGNLLEVDKDYTASFKYDVITKIYTTTIKGINNYCGSITKEVTISADEPTVIKLGDVDGDGKATIIDATLIQRHCVGITVNGEFNEAAADVDGSGDIEISDATFIQRYDANTETPYKIGEAIE